MPSNLKRLLQCLVPLAVGMLLASKASATPVAFSDATATFHQTFDRDWDPAQMIDGITSGANGWAIYRDNGQADQTLSETALFTLAAPVAAGSRSFTFTIYQNYGDGPNAFHELGDFSLGYTTDASPGLASAGTLMTITSASATSGATFTSASAGQLLVGGVLPDTDVYTITATVNSAMPITGIFLNAINDPASGLPTGGPGRQPSNGNFVLNEFTATTSPVPEPSTFVFAVAGLAALGLVLRSRAA